MKTNARKQGILMPISSIPSAYGIGTFGRESYRFVDFLEKSGNRLWQILPLGPTGYGDSPYQSFSTFAGNPYYIDLELLIEEGYLDYVDEMWYIYAAEEIRRKRLKEARNYSDEKIDAIMQSQLSEEELLEGGIKPNTIRLSIGTEHIDDIIADLEHGFQAVK